MLKSLAFDMAAAPSGSTQGVEMELLEIVRAPGGDATAPPLPATLSTIAPLGPPESDREFAFQSSASGHTHTINGLTFDMDRADEQIALGRVERWRFRNDSSLPHPVHLHGTHFQVESREGGRGTVYPYEGGWKDTVLVMPLELVSVLVRFDPYRGVFPLHCHNMQHEDQGMMLNIEVI
jgi:FtsP/CotA-like multicopper oxidase with cupredoxin domain